MTTTDGRKNLIISLNPEEYRMLLLMLGYACGSAEERKREDAQDWARLVDRLTKLISPVMAVPGGWV
jgi:hypothetical protein